MLPVFKTKFVQRKQKNEHMPYVLVSGRSHRRLITIPDKILLSDNSALGYGCERKARKNSATAVLAIAQERIKWCTKRLSVPINR